MDLRLGVTRDVSESLYRHKSVSNYYTSLFCSPFKAYLSCVWFSHPYCIDRWLHCCILSLSHPSLSLQYLRLHLLTNQKCSTIYHLCMVGAHLDTWNLRFQYTLYLSIYLSSICLHLSFSTSRVAGRSCIQADPCLMVSNNALFTIGCKRIWYLQSLHWIASLSNLHSPTFTLQTPERKMHNIQTSVDTLWIRLQFVCYCLWQYMHLYLCMHKLHICHCLYIGPRELSLSVSCVLFPCFSLFSLSFCLYWVDRCLWLSIDIC